MFTTAGFFSQRPGRTGRHGPAPLHCLAALAAAATLTACAATPPPVTAYDPSAIGPTIEQRMADCTTVHGYDPDAATVSENALAPGEREWRACVYGAIEAEIVPATQVPDAYRGLIAEDQAMTDAIEDGRLTRSARLARLEELAAEIRAAEAAAVAASDPRVAAAAAQERTEFVQRMVQDLSGYAVDGL